MLRIYRNVLKQTVLSISNSQFRKELKQFYKHVVRNTLITEEIACGWLDMLKKIEQQCLGRKWQNGNTVMNQSVLKVKGTFINTQGWGVESVESLHVLLLLQVELLLRTNNMKICHEYSKLLGTWVIGIKRDVRIRKVYSYRNGLQVPINPKYPVLHQIQHYSAADFA